MDTRSASFYDLIGAGLGNMSYQEFVDQLLPLKYNKLEIPGFSWDSEIQIDFTYRQIEAELGLYTMATYVDVDSPAVYKHTEGFELSSGKIPRMKHGFAMNEKLLREQMFIASQTGRYSERFSDVMMSLLFDSTDKLIGGNYNTVTYQRHQMVSTGALELLDKNNPDGIKNITFKANIPDANKLVLTGNNRWFTDPNGTEGSSSNPIRNLQDMVKILKNKGLSSYHFEVEKNTFEAFLNHSKVRQMAGWTAVPIADGQQAIQVGGNMLDDQVKSIVERKIGAPIVVIDSIVWAEKWDKEKQKIVINELNAFEPSMWVLVPDGSLGTIKAVQPIAVPDPGARIAFYDGGRTVLKQTFETRTNTQYIESELTCLVVPDKPKYMIYLKVA